MTEAIHNATKTVIKHALQFTREKYKYAPNYCLYGRSVGV